MTFAIAAAMIQTDLIVILMLVVGIGFVIWTAMTARKLGRVNRQRRETAEAQGLLLPDFAVGRRLVAAAVDAVCGWVLWYYPSRLLFPIQVSLVNVHHGFSFVVGGSVESQLPQYVLALLLYYVLFEWLFGATPGKALLGLRVIDPVGQRPGFRRALVRNVFRVIDLLPSWYLLGFLVAGFSRERQRIGDHVADTWVVSTRSVPDLRPFRKLTMTGLYAGAGVFTFIACVVSSYISPNFYFAPEAHASGTSGSWRVDRGYPSPARSYTDPGNDFGFSLTARRHRDSYRLSAPFTLVVGGNGYECAGTTSIRWGGLSLSSLENLVSGNNGWLPGLVSAHCSDLPARLRPMLAPVKTICRSSSGGNWIQGSFTLRVCVPFRRDPRTGRVSVFPNREQVDCTTDGIGSSCGGIQRLGYTDPHSCYQIRHKQVCGRAEVVGVDQDLTLRQVVLEKLSDLAWLYICVSPDGHIAVQQGYETEGSGL